MSYRILNSENELFNYLDQSVKESKRNVIIQTGHFALLYDQGKNELIPAIQEDIEDISLKQNVANHPYMGEFPLKTWELGVKLIAANPNRDIKASIIVNDWQWVPKAETGDLNDLRKKFYEKNLSVPKSYDRVLKQYQLSSSILLPFIKDNKNLIFFGEQKLRNRAKREFKELKGDDSAVSCAAGYLPFISYLDRLQNVDLLISFVPKTCKNPINYSTEYYMEKFDTSIKAINVFCNGTYEHNFFEGIEIVAVQN